MIRGLKTANHGHVVVVPGLLAHGKYPTAYWGSISSYAKKNATINYSWNKNLRDNVIYAYRRFTL